MTLVDRIKESFADVSSVVKGIFTRLQAIESRASSFGTADVVMNAVAVNGSQDVTVSFIQPMPNTNYAYRMAPVNLSGLVLANLQITPKSTGAKFTDKMIFTVKNVGIGLASGSFTLDVKVQLV